MKIPVPLARALLVASGAGFMVLSPAASYGATSNHAQEYAQARKIALKSPKVQAAYAKADEKLDERILEIDPSLKSYVEKRQGKTTPAPHETAKPVPPVKKPVTVKKTAGSTTHVVAKGETLSEIALHYKVSTASLKAANHISDDRKLQAGQKLVIPAATAKSSNAGATVATAKEPPGLWDRLKSNF